MHLAHSFRASLIFKRRADSFAASQGPQQNTALQLTRKNVLEQDARRRDLYHC